jgi:putative flippase GtrA
LSLILNIAIYIFLIQWGIDYISATVFGFVAETIFAYAMDRAWAFKGTTVGLKKGYLKYLAVSIFIFSIIIGVTILCVQVFGLDYVLSRLVAGAVAGIVNYILDVKFSFST